MSQGLPKPGDLVAGKYTVERLLGRGGMGAVYVVAHKITGKRLALKCLLPELLDQPELVERFVREAQAAGRIQHRNVVDIFDVGKDDGLLYIVMEHLQGEPLSELLREATITLEEALVILLRAMQGVAAAHELGIVHRDLKPDNIFVCVGSSGRLDDPRVLDFGISKVDDDVSAPLTRSGVAMGTPYYMSLEQITGQRDLDQRVDVYAMGVILYEAIAGQMPHAAESVGALAIRMMTQVPTHLRELRPDLPEGLAEVVMKAIAKERADRHPTMAALIEALRPFVPQAASLGVAEGRGLPLRTPRAASSDVSSDATLPASAGNPSPPWNASPSPAQGLASAPLVSQPQPVGAGQVVPQAVLAAASPSGGVIAAAPMPSDTRARGSSGKWVAVGVVLLAALALGMWLAQGPSPATPRAAAPQTAPTAPAASVPNLGSAPEPSPTTPSSPPVIAAPGEPAKAATIATPPEGDRVHPAQHRPRPHRTDPGQTPAATAPASTAVPPSQPSASAPQPAPTNAAPSAVKGRAGELKADDF